LLGCLTVFTARLFYPKLQNNELLKPKSNYLLESNFKIFFYLTLFFGMIGLLGAFQAWSVLISMYGSVSKALLNLGALYHMRVHGEIKGLMPYTSVFSYVAVFTAAIYSASKSRITLISVIPLLAIIIKEIAVVGRAGILFGFLEFALTFLFARRLLFQSQSIKKYKLFLSIVFTISLFILSITAVKNLRGTTDSFSGKTKAIKALDEGSFISSSIYLYASGHLGVLNGFLFEEKEPVRWGENTFLFAYNFLNKFKFVDKPISYPQGYYVPMWINTGTFLKELIADFGIGGTLIFLFLLGFFVSFFWFKTLEDKNIFSFIFLIFLTIIISLSFLSIATRLSVWIFSLVFLIIIFFIIQKVQKKSLLFEK
jgi:oligosaccharide repeat unit polymerase